MIDVSKFQEHTVRLYCLDNSPYTIETVDARSLLVVERFDLFAKLFYVEFRETKAELARKIYIEHIKAFNPDAKEPGREDKKSFQDFVSSFNALIDNFRDGEFDDTVSIVPVDKNGIILDGAHRVSALAYYNKKVRIARFSDVECVCRFDYKYFKLRGLSWLTCDFIANYMVKWCKNLYVACLWPRLSSQQKDMAERVLETHYQVAYVKEHRSNLQSLSSLMGLVYESQSWTKNRVALMDKASNCYGKSHVIRFVFFSAKGGLDAVLEIKEELRQRFGKGKHTVHITDNVYETMLISPYVLSEKRFEWQKNNKLSFLSKMRESLKEQIFMFKNIYLIQAKVAVAKILRR